MATPFARLPLEVISNIGDNVDAASLGTLRLSSRAMRDVFTPHFTRYHIKDSQSIDLTKQCLDRLRVLSSSPHLRPRIRRLHLTCIYYHETPAERGPDTTFPDEPIFPRRKEWFLHPLRFLDAPEDRKWMDHRQAEQFALHGAVICAQLSNALRVFGSLDEIGLEAAVVLGRQPEHRWQPHKVEHLAWKELWARAIQAYRVVMSAIARSQICLGSLSIYTKTKICSVPYHEAAAVVPIIVQEGFAAIGARLNHFSISLATAVPSVVSASDGDDDFYEPRDIPGGEVLNESLLDNKSELQDVERLFQLMPNVESLVMELYLTSHEQETFLDSYSPLLSAIFCSTARPRLLSLDLQGFPVETTLMEGVLSNSPNIHSIRLQHMSSNQNQWAQVLTPLTKAHSTVRSLYLVGLVSFDPQGMRTANVTGAIANDLVAVNPQRIHLASHGEVDVGTHRKEGLWIELSTSTSCTGMATYQDWVDMSNRLLERGPPRSFG